MWRVGGPAAGPRDQRGADSCLLQSSPTVWKRAPTTRTGAPPWPSVATTAAATAAAVGPVSTGMGRPAWPEVRLRPPWLRPLAGPADGPAPPPGSPQRISGKLSGRLFVGRSSSAEELGDADLHSYVVAKEGRTYVAVSSVGASLGPALRLLPVLGGVIGWAFALEQPGYRNGFSIAGGKVVGPGCP